MYKSYNYIKSNPNDAAIEDDYSKEDIIGMFVAYDNKSYKLFSTANIFIDYLNKLPADQRIYHEVIFDIPQKLRFDVDASPDKLESLRTSTKNKCANTSDFFNYILDALVNDITYIFLQTYEYCLNKKDIIICSSSSPSEKYSAHIIINNYYVIDHFDALEFGRKVYEITNSKIKQFIDMHIYKSLQNFRIAHCHKLGSNRIKQILTEHSISDTLITYIENCKPLPKISSQIKYNIKSDFGDTDSNNIRAVCDASKVSKGHVFYRTNNNLYLYNRAYSTYCDFCDRTHDKDNTLIFIANIHGDKIKISYACRKYWAENNIKSTKPVGEIISTNSRNVVAAADANVNKIDYYISKMIEAPIDITQNKFHDLDAQCKCIYNEPELREYELYNTLFVTAPMKMGKTKKLANYLKTYFSNKINTSIIRFISFRQTFTNAIKEQFPDFEVYSDHRGSLNQPKLIIQVESLHRLDIKLGYEPPDLLILDECESIFEQFDSGLLKHNINDCFEKFKYLIKYSKHIICMDAEITNRTYNIFSKFRPGFGMVGNTMYHCNTYQNAKDDKYYMTGDMTKWLSILYYKLEINKKMAIITSSLNEAKILKEYINTKYPKIKLNIYNSETSLVEKKQHFANVNKYWQQYDIIIYTPTVSAGISFEVAHFDYIFCYFIDTSCSIETCIQMMGRIRNVSSKEYFIYMSATGNTLPTNDEDITNTLIYQREVLSAQLNYTGMYIEYGEMGNINYTLSDYFYIWLENTKIRNISRNEFIKRFINIISKKGSQCLMITQEIYKKVTDKELIINNEYSQEVLTLLTHYKESKDVVKNREIMHVVNAPDIDENTYIDICNIISKQEELSPELRYAYKRYKLRQDYKYQNTITADFVLTYGKASVKYIYKNVSSIYRTDTTEDALKNIQTREKNILNYMISNGEHTLCRDISRKYLFNTHKNVLMLINLCGWKHIHSINYICHREIAHNISTSIKIIYSTIISTSQLLEIKVPRSFAQLNDSISVEAIIKYINKIIYKFYGLRISCRNELYSLNTVYAFNYTIENANRVEIPTIY